MGKQSFLTMRFMIQVLQGALIGVGAVLPGISGGVLSVVFGFYKTIMEFLAEPFKRYRTHGAKLFPVFLGSMVGFLGIANLLSFFLEKYPAQSVCVFVGLIGGMLPSLFREAGKEGSSRASYFSMCIAMITVFCLLVGLRLFSVTIIPDFGWYLFCGFCLALSIIAPGMSFSTLLMPLGLYEPFVAGIGHLDMEVLIPGGIGGLATLILLSRAVNTLFDRHYSVAFHAIVGIVIAATVMIIPFSAIAESVTACAINLFCLTIGVAASLWLDKFNRKYEI